MLSRGLKPYGNIKDGKQIRIISHIRKDKIEISEEEYDEYVCDVYVDLFGDFYMPSFCLDRGIECRLSCLSEDGYRRSYDYRRIVNYERIWKE